jgi:hypothetical protein
MKRAIQEMAFAGTELAVSSGRVFEVWLTVAGFTFCGASDWHGCCGCCGGWARAAIDSREQELGASLATRLQ